MKDIITNLFASFNNQEGGFSARKLTAFALMVLIAYTHYKYVDLSNAIEAILIDLAGVLIALGIITMEQVIKFKNGDKAE
jgi:hypothetical protein